MQQGNANERKDAKRGKKSETKRKKSERRDNNNERKSGKKRNESAKQRSSAHAHHETEEKVKAEVEVHEGRDGGEIYSTDY